MKRPRQSKRWTRLSNLRDSMYAEVGDIEGAALQLLNEIAHYPASRMNPHSAKAAVHLQEAERAMYAAVAEIGYMMWGDGQ